MREGRKEGRKEGISCRLFVEVVRGGGFMQCKIVTGRHDYKTSINKNTINI